MDLQRARQRRGVRQSSAVLEHGINLPQRIHARTPLQPANHREQDPPNTQAIPRTKCYQAIATQPPTPTGLKILAPGWLSLRSEAYPGSAPITARPPPQALIAKAYSGGHRSPWPIPRIQSGKASPTVLEAPPCREMGMFPKRVRAFPVHRCFPWLVTNSSSISATASWTAVVLYRFG
jgi:hypothetical protein